MAINMLSEAKGLFGKVNAGGVFDTLGYVILGVVIIGVVAFFVQLIFNEKEV